MSTQEIMALSREFDTIIGMVSNATPEKVERQVAIINAEIAEVKEGIVRYDYEEIRDGCLDVIKTVLGMMILTDQTPMFCEPAPYLMSYKNINREHLMGIVGEIEESVSKMYDAWENQVSMPVNGQRIEMGKDTLSNLCESALKNVYRVCEQYGIDVLGDYRAMHEGLMSRFDTSEENAKATAEYYAQKYGPHVELYYTTHTTESGKTLYINRLKSSVSLGNPNVVEPANKAMKSKFFKEPNYQNSKSIPPHEMRQLRSITRAELERMVEAKVKYTRLGSSTKTIATCEVMPGFVLVGTSATLCPRVFDAKLGEEVAYDEIIEQLWKLEGYARQRMRQLDICPESFYDHGA